MGGVVQRSLLLHVLAVSNGSIAVSSMNGL